MSYAGLITVIGIVYTLIAGIVIGTEVQFLFSIVVDALETIIK